MEREVGGGIGMGNTCKPMAVSFQCMTKSATIKIIIIKKIKNKLKKRKQGPWLELTLSYVLPRGNEAVPSQEAASRQPILSVMHTSLSPLPYRDPAPCQWLGVAPLQGEEQGSGEEGGAG